METAERNVQGCTSYCRVAFLRHFFPLFMAHLPDRKRNLRKCIDTLMKDEVPDRATKCINMLLTYCSNVLQNPTDQKFRQIFFVNPAFQKNIANIKAATDFLSATGWKRKVVEFREVFHFESEDLSALIEAVEVLTSIKSTAEEKAARYLHQKEMEATESQRRKEQALLAIKDDRERVNARPVPSQQPVQPKTPITQPEVPPRS